MSLQCVAVCCSVLQGVAGCCRVLLRIIVYAHIYAYAVRCSELQCIAMCCSVLQCVVPRERVCIYIYICMSLQHAAVCCSVLQCIAVRCGVWQCGLYSVCVSYGVASAWKSMHAYMRTGQWRPIGYFIFTGQFPHKSSVIGRFLAENDLQLEASCVSSPPCRRTSSACKIMHTYASSCLCIVFVRCLCIFFVCASFVHEHAHLQGGDADTHVCAHVDLFVCSARMYACPHVCMCNTWQVCDNVWQCVVVRGNLRWCVAVCWNAYSAMYDTWYKSKVDLSVNASQQIQSWASTWISDPSLCILLDRCEKSTYQGFFRAGSGLGFRLNSGSQMTPNCFIGVAWCYLTDVNTEIDDGFSTVGLVLGFHLSWESQMPPDRFNSVAWYYLTDTNIGIAGEYFTAGSSLGFHMNWGTPVVSRLLH